MAAVTLNKLDQRQQFIIFIWKGKKEYILSHNTPYEIFIAANFLPIFFTTTKQSAANINIDVFNRYFYIVLLLRTFLTDTYFPVDLSFFDSEKKFICSFSNFFSATNLNLWGTCKGKVLPSISTLYRGFTWVEREHREFLGITFTGLQDSRRLLTDYTHYAEDNNSYKTLSYDLLTQELYI